MFFLKGQPHKNWFGDIVDIVDNVVNNFFYLKQLLVYLILVPLSIAYVSYQICILSVELQL